MDEEEEAFCPFCGRESLHLMISRGRNPLARCLECGDIHPFREPEERPVVMVKAIVSEEEQSRVCQVELEPGEICAVGDHFVAGCGEDWIGVEVTSIERGNRRVKKAAPEYISALWTRKVEQVVVRVSLHAGRTTKALYIDVPGEEPFVIGEIYRHGTVKFRISRIKLRDGRLMMRREGAKAPARRIKRIYAYPL